MYLVIKKETNSTYRLFDTEEKAKDYIGDSDAMMVVSLTEEITIQIIGNVIGKTTVEEFLDGRNVVVDNYIKWMGDNFEKCDRRGLLESGFREGSTWKDYLLQGKKYIG